MAAEDVDDPAVRPFDVTLRIPDVAVTLAFEKTLLAVEILLIP